MSASYKTSEDDLNTLISKYSNDFTAGAQADQYDPITGRDTEIDQVILILLQKGRKNAMLQAPAGVGKTALCVGLAQRIVNGNVPDYLKEARVLELDLAAMAAGTSSISEFQGRLIPLLKGVSERYKDPNYPKTILFIDEIHQIMPNCEGSSYRGLSEVLKPYLTAGTLNVIGATTKDEYRIHVAVDPAMDRRFQKVDLSIPDAASTYIILQNLKPRFESHHGITIPNMVLNAIVILTNDHLKKRNQPDKSIITLDAACAYQVFTHGRKTELSLDSVYIMLAKETSLHPEALRLTDRALADLKKI